MRRFKTVLVQRKTPARTGSGRGKFGFVCESVIHETLAWAFTPNNAQESTELHGALVPVTPGGSRLNK